VRDPEQIQYDLELTRRRLAELPVGAYERRIETRERLRELQTELSLATRPSREVLLEELAALEARRTELADARIKGSFSSGGVTGSGIDPDFLHMANAKIDHETGIAHVEARIRTVKRLLGG
jgi:hypothetical protein